MEEFGTTGIWERWVTEYKKRTYESDTIMQQTHS